MSSVTRVRRELTNGRESVGVCVMCECCECVEEGGSIGTVEWDGSSDKSCYREKKKLIVL